MELKSICWRSIDGDWKSVEKYNRYVFLYELIIVGILAYLKKFLPSDVLRNPLLFDQIAREHAGATMLYHFLYDFAFPWMMLRDAIRSNDSETVSYTHLTLPTKRIV